MLSRFHYLIVSLEPLTQSPQRSVPGNQDVDASEYALASIRNDLRTRRAEAERRAESKVPVISSFQLIRNNPLHRSKGAGSLVWEHLLEAGTVVRIIVCFFNDKID